MEQREVRPAPPPQPPAVLPAPLIIELDATGRILGCSAGAAALLGRERVALVGASILDFVPESLRGHLLDAARSARQAPEQDLALPVLRLQGRAAAGAPAMATEPVKLTLRAAPDGCLFLHGQVQRPRALPLGSSDDRFSRIFHSSPDAILIVRHRDGVVLDFNEGFTRLCGFTREDAIGRQEGDLDLWVDGQQRQALLELFERSRSVTDWETRLRSSAGATLPVEISLRYIELDGELCVLCIARDISKRLEAESAARRSEEKFAQIFSQSPDGIVIVKCSDLTIRDANPAFIDGSGYSAEELLGKPLHQFNPVMDTAALDTHLATLAVGGRIANREMVFRRKNGEELPSLVSGKLTEIDGELCLVCVARDVSELRRAQEQLRHSEERFRGVFENAPIGILLLDTEGNVFRANRFAAEMLRYPEQALNGLHMSRLVPADERDDLLAEIQRLLGEQTPAYRAERRMLRANGEPIWTNCHIVLQPDIEPDRASYCIMQIADITEMKDSQRRMERLAFYDTLTDLANRRLFNDRLQQAVEHCRRHDERAALLYLDLDQFKRVNDTLGHESGDVLLREVAQRLRRCVRREDTVGRTGGDEFTILLYDIGAPSDAGTVAQKILRELQMPVNLSGTQLVVTSSIGITIIPDDGLEPNELLKNADLAMYRAKESGRNNVQFYREQLNINALRRLRTESELRHALTNQEFELHFQPVVRLADDALVGVESLIRWNHPERGMVPPDEFIGIAEETGTIVEIGHWAIEQACAAAGSLIRELGRPLFVAVNISPRQFRDPTLVDTVRRSLAQAGLDPSCLELEITETMLMQDVTAAAGTIQSLRNLGIHLAIDDFGTGYSSLSYLKRFPISTVKVDRSFISDIPLNSDDMAVTAAVIAMAQRLKLNVVAEGVETEAQRQFLLEQNCQQAQGFLFSAALPLAKLRRRLAEQPLSLRRP